MAIPKNCNECARRFKCKSWYGGSTCKYKNEIYNKYRC